MGNKPFRVVFVCTGNRCRSPYAGRLLASLTEGLPVTVESVGTLDSPGQPSPTELISIAGRGGIDLSAHGAVPMHPNSLADADLVIGFSFDHVSGAVVNGGASRNVTFLLPELTRLLEERPHASPSVENADVVSRARALVDAADTHRGEDRAMSDAEVADPFGGRRRAYEAMVEEVDRHVYLLARRLFGSQPSPFP